MVARWDGFILAEPSPRLFPALYLFYSLERPVLPAGRWRWQEKQLPQVPYLWTTKSARFIFLNVFFFKSSSSR